MSLYIKPNMTQRVERHPAHTHTTKPPTRAPLAAAGQKSQEASRQMQNQDMGGPGCDGRHWRSNAERRQREDSSFDSDEPSPVVAAPSQEASAQGQAAAGLSQQLRGVEDGLAKGERSAEDVEYQIDDLSSAPNPRSQIKTVFSSKIVSGIF